MTCDAPRNIYLDLGVNWCNTLQLYRDIPEARAQSEAPWEVWGFEGVALGHALVYTFSVYSA